MTILHNLLTNSYTNNPREITYGILVGIALMITAKITSGKPVIFPLSIIGLAVGSIWFGFKTGVF